jgi:GT2 family glycosyltransferase
MARLSIVIVAYNSRRDLDACLSSLTTHRAHIDTDVIVVDNASLDGTVDHVRARWPGVRLIEAGGNLGFAKANNLAIRQTSSELVLLLNPDTIVPAGAIDALVNVLDRQPHVAIVGPRLVDGEGRAELSFGRMISPFTELRQKILVRGNDRGVRVVQRLVERMTRVDRRVDWVSGACLLVRRTDLEAVGLLDERFFMYTEDVDLCAQVRARGRHVAFAPEATVVHLRGRSVASAADATRRAYRRSQIAFYEKHHPGWAPLLRLYLKITGGSPDRPNKP